MGRRGGLITASLLGLFLARLALELSGGMYGLPVVVGAAMVGIGVGWVIVGRQSNAKKAPWWIVPLAGYVLWPEYVPMLGIGVAAVVGVANSPPIPRPLFPTQAEEKGRSGTLKLSSVIASKSTSLVIAGVVFVVAATVYMETLAPGVLPADSGEFQKVTALLGIAHPPGYPLYTMVGHLFTLLPIGSLAWRTNLFSALTAAATLGMVAATVNRLNRLRGCGSVWGSIAGSVSLGAVPTFWLVATTASVRPLTAFFAATLAYTVASYASVTDRAERDRYLILFGLALGLGLAHHPSLLFVALASALAVLIIDPELIRQPRRWMRPGIAVAASLIVLAYLPLRAAAGGVDAPGDLTTVQGFLNVVLATGFGDHFFSFVSPDILLARLQVMLDILRYEFGDLLLLAALGGAIFLAWRDKRLLILFVGGALLHIFMTATFGSPQISEYLIPAYVLMAILIGYAVGELQGVGNKLRSGTAPLSPALFPAREYAVASGGKGDKVVTRGVLILLSQVRSSVMRLHAAELSAGVIVVAAVALYMQTLPNALWLAGPGGADTRNYVDALLQDAPQNAIILANWHWFTPLDYAIHVEGQRPDLDVEYVYPEGIETPAQTWLRRLNRAMDSGRPVIVTWIFQAEYAASPYYFEPVGEALVVSKSARRDVPEHLTSVNQSFGSWRLVGYRVLLVQPGGDFAVEVAWKAIAAPEQDTAFFVHLLGSDGIPIGQYDLRHAANRIQAGDVIYDRYPLAIPPGLPAGDYGLVAGAYHVSADGKIEPLKNATGETTAKLNDVAVEANASSVGNAPISQHPQQIAFEGCPTLIGVDHDFSVAGAQRVFLHWQGTVDRIVGCKAQIWQGEKGLGEALIGPLAPGDRQSINITVPASGESLVLRVVRADGQRALRRFVWGLALDVPLALPPAHGQDRYVPFGGGITLVGTDPVVAIQGGAVHYSLWFLARRPILRDNALTVRFSNPGWPETIQQDNAPALGALPTFKWVSGPAITDRHFARVPGPVDSNQPVRAQMQFYDLFTQRPLPILDPKLAQSGPLVNLTP
jgi:hypothetical protein